MVPAGRGGRFAHTMVTGNDGGRLWRFMMLNPHLNSSPLHADFVAMDLPNPYGDRPSDFAKKGGKNQRSGTPRGRAGTSGMNGMNGIGPMNAGGRMGQMGQMNPRGRLGSMGPRGPRDQMGQMDRVGWPGMTGFGGDMNQAFGEEADPMAPQQSDGGGKRRKEKSRKSPDAASPWGKQRSIPIYRCTR